MRDAIYNALHGDATLMGYLTGGLYRSWIEGVIDRQNADTAAAFDANKNIQPCALIAAETQSPVGPYLRAARLFVAIYFYDAPHAALQRAFNLLHDQRLKPVNDPGCWRIEWTDDVLDSTDEGLRCGLEISRFVAYILR